MEAKTIGESIDYRMDYCSQLCNIRYIMVDHPFDDCIVLIDICYYTQINIINQMNDQIDRNGFQWIIL